MRKFCTILVLSLVALLHVAPGCVTRKGAESPDDPAYIAKQPIAVRLIIPDEVFDPENPSENVIRCLVRNNAIEKVAIPSEYFGWPRDIELYQDANNEDEKLILDRVAHETPRKYVSLLPGEERLVFEFTLADILLDPSQKHWGWGWRGQHAQEFQAFSPIGKVGEWSSTILRARIFIDGKPYESNRVLLRVKGDERTKAIGGR